MWLGSLLDEVRSSNIPKKLGEEPLLILHSAKVVKASDKNASWTAPCGDVQLGVDHKADPEYAMYPIWPGNASGTPRKG